MTSRDIIGREAGLRRRSDYRRAEVTAIGRTRRADIYPGELCPATLAGLPWQMAKGDRRGRGFERDESNSINEARCDDCEMDEFQRCATRRVTRELAWARGGHGTRELMLINNSGPLLSARARRIARDSEAGQISEDRPGVR